MVVLVPLVVTLNVADVAFAATVTLDGTWAAVMLLLDNVTPAPPDGAGPDKVTVPVEDVPPITELGLTLTLARAGGVTVRVIARVVPRVAEMVADALDGTGLVVTGKVVDVAFAGTVMLAGTCAMAGLLLDRVITAPPGGAGPVILTVALEEVPPTVEFGVTARAETLGVNTVRLAVLVTP